MRIVIIGAGAVGSALGGFLSLHGHDVLLVTRKSHADAITARGLLLRSSTGEFNASPRVATSIGSDDFTNDTFTLITTKSYDIATAVAQLKDCLASGPVVTMQNGVDNEAAAADAFECVIGGVWRTTCSMLQPGQVTLRGFGRVIFGKYPKGASAQAKKLAAAVTDAGFEAVASNAIMCDKWLKLALNTQSAVHAVVDRRDHETPEFYRLKADLLTETGNVFAAAGVKARSCDGRDPSIDEMIADLKRPRLRRTRHGFNVHNSTWQDLYLKRDHIESESIHGPILRLAKEHGVSAPLNTGMFDVVRACHASGAGPQSLRLADVMRRIDEGKQT